MNVIRLRKPGGLDHLSLGEAAAPSPPGPGEILVRIHASSLNYHDYAVARGMIPTPDGHIPLSDGAGVVEAVGADVRDFVPGDNVVSCFYPGWLDGAPLPGGNPPVPGDGVDGYACEYVTRPADWFTAAPKGYSHAEAATLTTAGLTAWRALVADGGLKAGATVLVLGTGGVSIFALQIAVALGAQVIGTSSSDSKLERLKAMGAAHVINYKSVPDWGAEVQKLTAGRGADHVIEIGGAGTLAQSITAVGHGGHIALIGVLGGLKGDIPSLALMWKQARLQGVMVGNRRQQMDFVRALEVTGIRPVIDRSFALTEIADAFRYEESGTHFGKICLEF